MNSLDLLVIAPHPDDAELGVGGTIALHTSKGYQVGICDLTQGEMGTNGTIEIRRQESQNAAEILGVAVRENLKIPDGFIRTTEENLKKTVSLIRKYRPETIITIYSEDDHPDHIHASQLVREAAHLSGLYKYPGKGEPFRPSNLYFFLAARPKNPDLVVDITSVHKTKIDSILAHKSQLGLDEYAQGRDTRLTHPSFLERIKARDRYMGHLGRCELGEGLICDRIPRINDLLSIGGA
ncbi:bacillithiol biosynthesis deacetylase BshB1 [Natranaerobius thermophilus]|uniref:LmbE family protein n=1 Tax=Natranaerobius thermophilus (strain ATCC BAA-1301 / DSM 18059 / JW/NM-WN-LF) TaxID=457570 RepID=B2A253_NATTJ|nr:bacillithiol biosynthesis deacetylase BshB1 [Natranaerobius thermophilus]ACB84858.1 LmbE family protein [Natranaerobius thermophilus JW/NM-WN-LF]